MWKIFAGVVAVGYVPAPSCYLRTVVGELYILDWAPVCGPVPFSSIVKVG